MSFLNECDRWRFEYTLLLKREENADNYFKKLSNEKKGENISDERIKEIEEEENRWLPEYKLITEKLAELLGKINFYTPENIIRGWPEIKNDK